MTSSRVPAKQRTDDSKDAESLRHWPHSTGAFYVALRGVQLADRERAEGLRWAAARVPGNGR